MPVSLFDRSAPQGWRGPRVISGERIAAVGLAGVAGLQMVESRSMVHQQLAAHPVELTDVPPAKAQSVVVT